MDIKLITKIYQAKQMGTVPIFVHLWKMGTVPIFVFCAIIRGNEKNYSGAADCSVRFRPDG
jgi:hypothetical protein